MLRNLLCNHKCWCKFYLNDTHTVLVNAHAQEFTDCLNSIVDDIKLTTAGESITHTENNEKVAIGTRVERAMGFLDTLSMVIEDGSV